MANLSVPSTPVLQASISDIANTTSTPQVDNADAKLEDAPAFGAIFDATATPSEGPELPDLEAPEMTDEEPALPEMSAESDSDEAAPPSKRADTLEPEEVARILADDEKLRRAQTGPDIQYASTGAPVAVPASTPVSDNKLGLVDPAKPIAKSAERAGETSRPSSANEVKAPTFLSPTDGPVVPRVSVAETTKEPSNQSNAIAGLNRSERAASALADTPARVIELPIVSAANPNAKSGFSLPDAANPSHSVVPSAQQAQNSSGAQASGNVIRATGETTKRVPATTASQTALSTVQNVQSQHVITTNNAQAVAAPAAAPTVQMPRENTQSAASLPQPSRRESQPARASHSPQNSTELRAASQPQHVFAAPTGSVAITALQNSPNSSAILGHVDAIESSSTFWPSAGGSLSAPQEIHFSAAATTRLEHTVQLPNMPRHIASQIAQILPQSVDRPIELALNPEELGRVRISLSGSEGAMSVIVLAERPETLDLMRRNIVDLAAEFQRLGYSDLNFSFGQSGNNQPDPEPREGAPELTATQDQMTDITAPITLELGNTTGLDLRL